MCANRSYPCFMLGDMPTDRPARTTAEVIRSRRMTRRFDPDRPVDDEQLAQLIDLATYAPSAGFSQGWHYLALTDSEVRARFWGAASTTLHDPDPWLAGVSQAPALVLCLSDPQAYLDRYAESDKGWGDRDLSRWPIPYWDTDVAMGAMAILLGAHEVGLGALFFGVPAQRHDAVRAAFGIPDTLRLVGAIAIGHPRPGPRSRSLRRGRRGNQEVISWGRYGESHRRA